MDQLSIEYGCREGKIFESLLGRSIEDIPATESHVTGHRVGAPQLNSKFNLKRFKLLLVCAVSIGDSQYALHAAPAPYGGLQVRENWEVMRVSCPVGCSDYTRSFLRKQQGARLSLSPSGIRAPFIEPCGPAVIELKKSPITAIVDELNRIARNPPFKRTDLPLRGKTALNGYVFCKANGVRSPAMRILSYRRDEMIVLFEERSLLILR